MNCYRAPLSVIRSWECKLQWWCNGYRAPLSVVRSWECKLQWWCNELLSCSLKCDKVVGV